jgi:hypothetical protein
MPDGVTLAPRCATREAAGPARVITPSAANAAWRVNFDVNMIEPPREDAPWERLQLIINGVDT